MTAQRKMMVPDTTVQIIIVVEAAALFLAGRRPMNAQEHRLQSMQIKTSIMRSH